MATKRQRVACETPCKACNGPRYRNGKTGLCEGCINVRQGKSRVRQRRYIAKQYGLTLDQYELMMAAPCWLCGSTERRMCADHDHTTGEVRGALCHICNTIIGMVEKVGLHVIPRISQYLIKD